MPSMATSSPAPTVAKAPAGRSQSPPELGEEAPLGLERPARLGPCSMRASSARRPTSPGSSPVAALDGQRALTDLRQHDVDGSSTSADVVEQAEPLERGEGHDDRPVPGRLGQAGVDVAPQPGEGQVGSGPGQLGPAPGRAGGHHGPRGQPVEGRADEHVTGVAPLGHGGDVQTVGRARGQVLGRVHGESARPSSTAACTSLANTPLPPISQMGMSWRRSPSGLDHHDLDHDLRVDRPQPRGHVVGLPPGERAAARGGSDHRRHATRLPDRSDLQVEQVAQRLGQTLTPRRCRPRP